MGRAYRRIPSEQTRFHPDCEKSNAFLAQESIVVFRKYQGVERLNQSQLLQHRDKDPFQWLIVVGDLFLVRLGAASPSAAHGLARPRRLRASRYPRGYDDVVIVLDRNNRRASTCSAVWHSQPICFKGIENASPGIPSLFLPPTTVRSALENSTPACEVERSARTRAGIAFHLHCTGQAEATRSMFQ